MKFRLESKVEKQGKKDQLTTSTKSNMGAIEEKVVM